MSQNPYATFGTTEAAPQARTSVMAILSLVSSLICCIPGLGAIAAILGGVALLRISGSNGRRTGVGLAIAGIIIGLIVSLIWIFAAIGAKSVLDKAGQLFTPIVQTVATEDSAAIRAAVSPTLSTAITDADWKRFKGAITDELGTINYKNVNAFELIRQYGEVGKLMQNQQGTNAIPIPLFGDKGKGVLLVHMPRGNTTINTPGPNGQGSPASEILAIATNFSVLLPSGKEIWLVPEDRLPAPGATPALPPAAPDAPKPNGV